MRREAEPRMVGCEAGVEGLCCGDHQYIRHDEYAAHRRAGQHRRLRTGRMAIPPPADQLFHSADSRTRETPAVVTDGPTPRPEPRHIDQ
jgi:hypothetical protein